MTWRVAKSLDILLRQINEVAPGRSILSDGSIASGSHTQANPSSDHEPHCDGNVVTARDFTHDPAKGADMNKITEALRQSQDARIKYVLWNHRMFSSYPTSTHKAWTWRPYSGSNPHDKHAHVSVQCNASKDSERPWSIQRKEWDEMATEAEVRKIVKEEIQAAIKKLAVGREQNNWNPENVNLKKAIEGQK